MQNEKHWESIAKELERGLTPKQWKAWHTRLTTLKAWPAGGQERVYYNVLVIWVNAMVKLTNTPRDPGVGYKADLSFFGKNLPIWGDNLAKVAEVSFVIGNKLTKELTKVNEPEPD